MTEKKVMEMPFVDPRVTDPRALKYQEEMRKRRYEVPVGGPVQASSMPRLDQPHQEGITMADHATIAQQPPPGSVGGIFEQGPVQAPGASSSGLLAQDILPSQATSDPDFRTGHGSMFAVNQPHLAMKYGVIRNRQHIPPQMLQKGAPGLRPQTIEDLKKLQELEAASKKVSAPDAAVEHAASQGPAGAAARIASPSGDENIKPSSEEEREKIRKVLSEMDEFDFNALKEAQMKDMLNNTEQKDLIEKKLKPLDLTDLIVQGFITQTVPINPGVFEPEFRSLSGEEDLALKRLLMEDSTKLKVSDRYHLDKFSLMAVACGLNAINKKPMPLHTDPDGSFNDELFWKKFQKVVRFPLHMLASLGVHMYWFDIRVRKLFVVENLKNG